MRDEGGCFTLKQQKWVKHVAALVMMAILGASLIGCSAAPGSQEKSDGLSSSASVATSADSAASTASTEAAKAEAPAEAKAVTTEASNTANTVNSGVAAPGANSAYERKLIYKANVTMQVEDYGQAQTELQNMIQLAGGYMLQFSDIQSSYERGGNYTFKVPQTGFNNVMNQLQQMKHKEYQRNVEGQDVTEEYVDLAARLKAKKVVEQRLLSFMEKATAAGDLLKYSTELGNVQEQIEQIEGRMRYLDQNVAYSTITLRLYELVKREPSQMLAQTFGAKISDTFHSSIDHLVELLQWILLVIIALFPFILLFAVILIPFAFYWRNKRKVKRKMEIEEND